MSDLSKKRKIEYSETSAKEEKYDQMDKKSDDYREYVFQVGNINKSMATMVDTDYNLMEIPKYMLPK